MTTTTLRIQLALALGLPSLAACKSKPPAPPGGGDDGVVIPADGSGANKPPVATGTPPKNGTCAVDHVHEHVCGLTDKDHQIEKVKAPAPHDVCGINPIPLVQFDDYVFVDSSRWGNHDPELKVFAFDLARSQSYKYGGTVNPGDVWCCYERCAPLAVTQPRTALPPKMYEHEVCTPAPEAGTSIPAKTAPQCPAAQKLSYGYGIKPVYVDNAPFKRVGDKGECCYAVASMRKCDDSQYEDDKGNCRYPERGRPLREDDRVIVAPVRERADWQEVIEDTFASLDAETRAYAAGAWTREAAAEHSSVASFARLSIELMMLGAPSDLVDEAHAAARDEIRHATLAFGLASAIGGVPVGPGPLAVPPTPGAPTLAELVIACFREGCVGEAVAAMAAASARREAIHAPIQTALDAITADEARHAALAYKIVAWALREDATVRAIVEAELLRAVEEYDGSLDPDPRGFDPRLGVLSTRAAHVLRLRVIADVVRPLTETLLA